MTDEKPAPIFTSVTLSDGGEYEGIAPINFAFCRMEKGLVKILFGARINASVAIEVAHELIGAVRMLSERDGDEDTAKPTAEA